MNRRTWLILTVLYLVVGVYLTLGSVTGFTYDFSDHVDRTVYYTDADLIAHREERTDSTGGMMSWGAEGYSYSNFPLMIHCIGIIVGFIPLIAVFPNEKETDHLTN